MTLEVFAYDTLTGQRLTPLPTTSASWSVAANSDEKVTCSIPMRSRQAQQIDAFNATTPVRVSLAAMVDGEPVAAGPVWKQTFDGSNLKLDAGGIRSYLARRLALPVAARSQGLILPSGDPNTALDTVFTKAMQLSLGTIGKRYVELVSAWPSGGLPIVLPADVLTAPGQGHERTVRAVDLKPVKGLLDDLSNVIGGPDFEFRAVRSADGGGVRHLMLHGTPQQPRLGATDPDGVRFALEKASAIQVTNDATAMASEAFVTGGGQQDKVIAVRGFSPTLGAAGFPLLQVADKGRSSVSQTDTLQGYADQAVMLGASLVSGWQVTMPARDRGVPRLGRDYWLGDLVTLAARPGYPIAPNGLRTVRRVSSISGDDKDSQYKITFAEVLA